MKAGREVLIIGLSAVALSAVLGSAAAGYGQGSAQPQGGMGIFEGQSDVGIANPPGSASFDPASGVYTIAGSGDDLFDTQDGFHLLWKKVSGDVSLTADIQVANPGPKSIPHRKGLLMFRQSLDPDSMYADAAVHGSGETSLQYRHAKGDTTQSVLVDPGGAKTIRLEKRGDTITLFASFNGEPLHQVGASIKLHFTEPFYAGLGVCSHHNGTTERVMFSRVEMKALAAPESPAHKVLFSTLQTIAIDNNARFQSVILTGKGQMEAPNWSRDGKTLMFDRDGRMWSVPVKGGEPTAIDVGNATGCNGSHGLSPDGKWLAITCTTPEHPGNRIYIVPSGGGEPRMVTPNRDSYFHSWSPDGKPSPSRAGRTAASPSCRFLRKEARRRRSPQAREPTTIRTTRLMGSTSTSTPIEREAWKFFACIRMARIRNR